MPTSVELTAKVAQFIAASDKSHALVDGPATGPASVVDTTSGPIKTFPRMALEYGALDFHKPYAVLYTFAPPVTGEIYVVTVGNLSRKLIKTDTDLYHATDEPGGGDPRMSLSGGDGDPWVLYDYELDTTWNALPTMYPTTAVWIKGAGDCEDIPYFETLTEYPRLIHFAPDNRTWVISERMAIPTELARLSECLVPLPQVLVPSIQRQVRTNISARQLPPQDFGVIYKMAVFGDSIPGATSGPVTYGSGYMANGFPAHMRYAMQGMIELVANPIEGSNDFALGSRTTSSFIVGGPDRATFDALLASDADTVMYALGNNDVNSIALATTKANMLSQWDEIEAAGMKLVIMSLFPGGINRPTDYIQGVHQLNHWMEYQAAIRGALYVDITQVCDDNKDGVSDSAWMQDHIHPNNGGACRVGYYTADRLMPYVSTANRTVIPAYGDAAWKTPNSHATLGTLGSNQLATSWTASAVGAGTTLQNNILTRTDGRAGRWQQFVISGATEAGTFLTNPTHYVQAYVTSSPFAVSIGDRFQLLCETYFPTESTFYGIRAFMHDTVDGYTQRHDLNHEGAYAAMKSGKFAPYRHGILRSNELVITVAGTRTLRAWFYVYGNGTVNIGPFGVVKL